MLLKDKKILIGITGSIAAYKTVHLVRLLVKAGAEVRIIMTPSAKDFVTPLTLSTLSRNTVLTELFDEQSWSNHVMLGRWADVLLIAPLSCNTLAKMANGHCDNLLLATYLSATCPVVVAPAMDEDMWHHPSTRKNLALLTSFNNHIIPVEKGDLASGLYGDGRMAEPETILQYLTDNFFLTRPLAGKKAVVTAGPTYEQLDPVRFIGNNSSGKMGWEIAKELHRRGAEVTLIMGPNHLATGAVGVKTINVRSADEMYEAAINEFSNADMAIMAAAVADYTPQKTFREKIKKAGEETLTLELKRTKDILKTLGTSKKSGQVVVGFALETNNERQYALEKLAKKNADMIVLNSLNDAGAGFGHDTNKISIFNADGQEFHFALQSKTAAARNIIDTITKLYYA